MKDITIDENKIKKLAKEIYEIHIERKEYDKALWFAKKYNLLEELEEEELVKKAARKAYESCMEKERYFEAAWIAREYNLGEKFVELAAKKAHEYLMRRNYGASIRILKRVYLDLEDFC